MALVRAGSVSDQSYEPVVDQVDMLDETKPSRIDLPIDEPIVEPLALVKSNSRGSKHSFQKLSSHEDNLIDSARRERLEEKFPESLPLPTKMNVNEKPVSLPVDIKKPAFKGKNDVEPKENSYSADLIEMKSQATSGEEKKSSVNKQGIKRFYQLSKLKSE